MRQRRLNVLDDDPLLPSTARAARLFVRFSWATDPIAAIEAGFTLWVYNHNFPTSTAHTDGPGGAIRSGNIIGFGAGAMELFVHNCLFSGNTADSFGGAIVLDDNPLAQIINSTLVNNSSGAGGVSSFANFLKDDTELFKQFMDHEGFRRWLTDTVFRLTYTDDAA